MLIQRLWRTGVCELWQESWMGERKLKNNETKLTEMRDGVYMYLLQWPGMIISVLWPKH